MRADDHQQQWDRAVCFRYFTIDPDRKAQQEVELFAHRRIYYARPAQYVDAREFEFELAGPYTLHDSIRDDWGFDAAVPHLDLVPQLKPALFQTLSSLVRCCCFTHTHTNAHLWQHYASNRTGYMVAFKVPSFEDRASIPRLIDYIEAIPIVAARTAFAEGTDDMMRVVFRKHPDFVLEQEWRSIVTTDEPYVKLPDDAIAFVILGENMSEANKAAVLALIDQHHPNMCVGETGAGLIAGEVGSRVIRGVPIA